MPTMEGHSNRRINERVAFEVDAECIKISGRSDVFSAKSTNFSKNGLNLISRKPVKPGANLIIRMHRDVHSVSGCALSPIDENGLTEVCWVKEVMGTDGMPYAMGIKYLYAD